MKGHPRLRHAVVTMTALILCTLLLGLGAFLPSQAASPLAALGATPGATPGAIATRQVGSLTLWALLESENPPLCPGKGARIAVQVVYKADTKNKRALGGFTVLVSEQKYGSVNPTQANTDNLFYAAMINYRAQKPGKESLLISAGGEDPDTGAYTQLATRLNFEVEKCKVKVKTQGRAKGEATTFAGHAVDEFLTLGNVSAEIKEDGSFNGEGTVDGTVGHTFQLSPTFGTCAMTKWSVQDSASLNIKGNVGEDTAHLELKFNKELPPTVVTCTSNEGKVVTVRWPNGPLLSEIWAIKPFEVPVGGGVVHFPFTPSADVYWEGETVIAVDFAPD